MNAKKMVTFIAVMGIFFLSGCVAPPYYGGTRASYGFHPTISFYGPQRIFGGYRHASHRLFNGRYRRHFGHKHIYGGHRHHFGGGYKGRRHRGYGGGHRGRHH